MAMKEKVLFGLCQVRFSSCYNPRLNNLADCSQKDLEFTRSNSVFTKYPMHGLISSENSINRYARDKRALLDEAVYKQ